jgi:glycogen synthase
MFEYFATGRPILALVPEGETADLLREHGNGYIVNEEKEEFLVNALNRAFKAYYNASGEQISVAEAHRGGRQNRFNGRDQARVLARVFSQVMIGGIAENDSK